MTDQIPTTGLPCVGCGRREGHQTDCGIGIWETSRRYAPTEQPLYQSIATLASNWTQSIADVAIEEGWEWKQTGANIMWRKHISGPTNPDDGKWSAESHG